jgi:hypothetical protein
LADRLLLSLTVKSIDDRRLPTDMPEAYTAIGGQL